MDQKVSYKVLREEENPEPTAQHCRRMSTVSPYQRGIMAVLMRQGRVRAKKK